jgi:hypothetical protein
MEPNRAPRVLPDGRLLIFPTMLWARARDSLGTSRLVAGRRYFFFSKVARGEGAMEPNRAPRVLPDG